MKTECQKYHAVAVMEAATIEYEDNWKPYCLTHLAEQVAQGKLQIRRIGQKK